MNYRLVYALLDDPIGPRLYLFAGIVCAAIALLCLTFRRRTPMMLASGVIRMHSGMFFGIWFSGVTMFIVAFGSNDYADYRGVMKAVRERREHTLEGPIDTFEATGITNHKTTTLIINETKFTWNESQAGRYGYNAMPSPQSPVQQGKRARVTYVDDPNGFYDVRITRLEVAE
jgi:hypothetical protein